MQKVKLFRIYNVTFSYLIKFNHVLICSVVAIGVDFNISLIFFFW